MVKKFLTVIVIPFILQLFVSSNALAEEEQPKIECEAFIIMEESSGRVLYEKNADVQMYPASLTKVATAIYAIENANLEDVVTVSERARNAEGTRVYLEEGEQVPLKKLVQGLLVNSGNDAGVAIAEHIDGSVGEFATQLNLYLKEIGLKDTYFKNPHGLFDPDHVTTAKDLAKITQYAVKNEEFRSIFGMKELKWKGKAWDTTIFTHHKLMRERPYEGVTGGKTGYVDESGNTLITTAKRGDLSVIVVVLKGDSQNTAYNDTVELLDYAFDNFKLTEIPAGKEFNQNQHTYTTTASYFVPLAHGEEINEQVTEEGKLKVTVENQDFLATLPLKDESAEVVSSPPKEVAATSLPKEEEKSSNPLNLLVISTLIFIGIVVIFIVSRKFSRNKKSRSLDR
ncbi:D-alanyl-D-alanine carboxypeptidase [Mesobacillus maritimus]|uniref:D-alanyl-D-alanine carboxypeptidase family protein n=1 Tax=Mesobacillus maritimus TaxID=1643336 RepID=UPI00203F2DDB|nr:D-alanyl-D-alanine carboxypeptidase family protein [Mesobacillus maritimus]MCM3584802.1 D-alanyl-D-alanine carboxypeptidase [Mesobacillus maritimus]MCM3671215.1 D-alanyl-D-alanine carboxypeptidase [Mesobacillus maritimus]